MHFFVNYIIIWRWRACEECGFVAGSFCCFSERTAVSRWFLRICCEQCDIWWMRLINFKKGEIPCITESKLSCTISIRKSVKLLKLVWTWFNLFLLLIKWLCFISRENYYLLELSSLTSKVNIVSHDLIFTGKLWVTSQPELRHESIKIVKNTIEHEWNLKKVVVRFLPITFFCNWKEIPHIWIYKPNEIYKQILSTSNKNCIKFTDIHW